MLGRPSSWKPSEQLRRRGTITGAAATTIDVPLRWGQLPRWRALYPEPSIEQVGEQRSSGDSRADIAGDRQRALRDPQLGRQARQQQDDGDCGKPAHDRPVSVPDRATASVAYQPCLPITPRHLACPFDSASSVWCSRFRFASSAPGSSSYRSWISDRRTSSSSSIPTWLQAASTSLLIRPNHSRSI